MAYKDIILARPSLYRYWLLNSPSGTEADLEAGATLTFAGTVTRDVTGGLADGDEGAAQFDGTTGRATSPMLLQATAFTVEMIVRKDGAYNSTDDDLLFEYSARWFETSDSLVCDLHSADEAATIALGFRSGGNQVRHTIPQSALPVDADFHHLLLVFDTAAASADRIRVWVDGAAVATTVRTAGGASLPAFNEDVLTTFGLVHRSTTNGQCAAVTLQHLAMYTTALTGTQALESYEAMQAGPAPALQLRQDGEWVPATRYTRENGAWV